MLGARRRILLPKWIRKSSILKLIKSVRGPSLQYKDSRLRHILLEITLKCTLRNKPKALIQIRLASLANRHWPLRRRFRSGMIVRNGGGDVANDQVSICFSKRSIRELSTYRQGIGQGVPTAEIIALGGRQLAKIIQTRLRLFSDTFHTL
jgi:hypothetical protein